MVGKYRKKRINTVGKRNEKDKRNRNFVRKEGTKLEKKLVNEKLLFIRGSHLFNQGRYKGIVYINLK